MTGGDPDEQRRVGCGRMRRTARVAMDLARGLSSPAGPLKAVLDQRGRRAKRATDLIPEPLPAVGPQHRRMGWVIEAVEQVLSEHGQPMQAKAVHLAVEAHLGRAVSWSSIKGALADHVAGPSPRFERLGRGRYRLR